METYEIIILTIIILAVLLVALLVYLLTQNRRSGQGSGSWKQVDQQSTGTTQDLRLPGRGQRTGPQQQTPAAYTGPSSTIENATGPTRAAQAPPAQRMMGRDAATPVHGLARADVTGLLEEEDTKATAARPAVPPPAQSGATGETPAATTPPPESDKPKRPPRKRTVALGRPIFNDAPGDADTGPMTAVSPTSAASSSRATPAPFAPSAPGAAAPSSAPAPQAPAPKPQASQPAPAAPHPPPPSAATPAAPAASKPPERAPAPQAPEPPPAAQPEPEIEDTIPTDRAMTIFRDANAPARLRLDAFGTLLSASGADERAIHIVEALNDASLELQIGALQEIANHADDTLLDDVIPLVESDTESVALAAIGALEAIGGPVVEQALLAALESPHQQVREHATNALPSVASPMLEEQLIEMLADDETSRVRAAARALGEVGSQQGLEALEVTASMQVGESNLNVVLAESIEKLKGRIARGEVGRSGGFEGPGGKEPTAIDEAAGGDDEFALSLDPELFGGNE